MAKGRSRSFRMTDFSNVRSSFVEFETAADLKVAVEKLDNQDFKGTNVRCTADVRIPHRAIQHPTKTKQEQSEVPRNENRHRSRSPPYRRGGYASNGGYYNGRRDPLPSRGYSPHRDDGGYRRRSPPPRSHYYDESRDHGRYRSPPRGGTRGPPIDEPYPPARGGGYDDPYGPPTSRRYPEEPYPTNGYPRSRVGRTPPRSYEYDPPRRYW
jgi:transcription initiation factor TFIID subunit 15